MLNINMKKYLYVFDYSLCEINRIDLDEKDDDQDVISILKRRGLKESQCAYMFSDEILDILKINPL